MRVLFLCYIGRVILLIQFCVIRERFYLSSFVLYEGDSTYSFHPPWDENGK